MAAETGISMLFKVGANAIGAERGGSVTFTREIIEKTVKSSANDAEFEYGILDAAAQVEGLYVFNDTAQGALETANAGGTTATVDITTGVSGERHFQFASFCTGLSRDDPNEEMSTMSGQVTSTGAITYADV